MDIISKIDRTLLDNELRSIIRFAVFRESDKALFLNFCLFTFYAYWAFTMLID